MLANCETTIKVIASLFFILCALAIVVLLLVEVGDSRYYAFGSLGGFIAIEVGLAIAGVVGSAILYGFGEIVECVKEIRDNSKN